VLAARTAVRLGIEKIRLTGGEPMLHRNFFKISSDIRNIENLETLALTTNGCYLKGNIARLEQTGFDLINVSLDSADPRRYRDMTGGELKNVMDGLEMLLEAGFCTVKINAVLIRGFNDDPASVDALLELVRFCPADLRFIELMPMPGGRFGTEHYVSAATVLNQLRGRYQLEPQHNDGTSVMFRIPGFAGRIGFIAPVSRKFCNSCNRIRITADGFVLPCLHGRAEFSIRDLEPQEMERVLSSVILAKPASHSLHRGAGAGRIMCAIGG
jgi:cyclic pyranopterin phosphate synthase